MRKRILNFSDEMDNKLQELKTILKMPINKIINNILKEKLENIKELDKEYLEDYKTLDDGKEKEIRFFIKQKEFLFLEEQIKKSGNRSLTNEIRYRLINTIYKNKYFLPIELKELSNLNFQIKRIGININQLNKKINQKEVLINEDYKNLKNSLHEVNNKIDLVSKEIKNILQFANNRD